MKWWQSSLKWLGKLVVTVAKEEIEAVVHEKIQEKTQPRQRRGKRYSN